MPLAIGFLVFGCSSEDDDGDDSPTTVFSSGANARSTLVGKGRVAYETFCTGCHGQEGDGQGEAARFLSPRPRDFTTGRYKFSSTRAGQLPTDSDLQRTIVKGLKGSSMPGWERLSQETIHALIAYIKTFSTRWEEQPPAQPIPVVENPYRWVADKSQAIVRGEAVYHGFAVCWSCHPAYVPEARINQYHTQLENPARDEFRPDLHLSEAKINTDGELVFPPDFKRDFVRAGSSVDHLYRSIAAGISGSAMPTWIDSINVLSDAHPDVLLVSSSDLWALAYYVQDLIKQRPAKLSPNQFVTRDRKQRILGPNEKWTPQLPEPEPAFGGDWEYFREEEDE